LSWKTFQTVLATAGRQVRNNETGRYLWRQTTTRARAAHGKFGRQTMTGKAKAGDAINVTGFHSRAVGTNQKD
jgi:hypothetical protein